MYLTTTSPCWSLLHWILPIPGKLLGCQSPWCWAVPSPPHCGCAPGCNNSAWMYPSCTHHLQCQLQPSWKKQNMQTVQQWSPKTWNNQGEHPPPPVSKDHGKYRTCKRNDYEKSLKMRLTPLPFVFPVPLFPALLAFSPPPLSRSPAHGRHTHSYSTSTGCTILALGNGLVMSCLKW